MTNQPSPPPPPPHIPGNILQALDQFESLLRDFAPVLAAYRTCLIEAGIPKELANQLTLDMQHVFWSNSLGKKS